MTISKRIVSLFLCLILAVTNFAVVAGAEEVTSPPDVAYLENGLRLKLTTVYEETAYMVSQSEKNLSGDIIIPEEYMGVPIRKINSSAFSYYDDITSVTMPDTIWVIMNGAFNSCPNLRWVNISKSVIDIDSNAFLAMHGLEELRMGGELNGEGRRFSYNTGLSSGIQLGYMNYFVRDGVLFSNNSLYLTTSGYRYFDNVKIEYYPQGRKNEIYKIPNDVVSTDLYSFLSPVYLNTLVVPASVRYFATETLYYYDSNARDKLNGPVTVVFQHDGLPETVKGWYYNDSGVKKSVSVPLYISGGWIYDSWDGSQLIFKNDTVSAGFAEKEIAEEAKDGDGGSELPAFVVAPKATEELKLDTFIDEIDLDDTVTIFATQSPLDTTDDLEFSTADESIASFDGFSRGYLSGNKVGTTTYYVKSGDKVVEHDITVICDHIDRNGNSTLSDWTQTKAPTCTEDGTEVITCTQEGCQQIVETRAIDKRNHTKTDGSSAYSDVITAPDCYNQGYTTHTCSLCKDVVVDSYTDALNHKLTNGSSAYSYYSEVAAKCEEDGHTIEKCSLCGNEQVGEIIGATGHNYVGKITLAPGCTSEGVMTYTCSNSGCNDSYTEAVSPKGHNFGDWYETLAPTCTEKGIDERKCSSCGAIETRDVKALGHNYSTEWTTDVEPTCTKDGSKSHHCSRCDSKADITIIGKLGHDYGDWVITKEPTCTEEGSKHKDCSRCDSVVTETVKANGHTEVVDKAVNSTCSETGLTEGSHCSVCGEVLKTQEVVEKKPHTESDWIIDEYQTCIKDGSKYKECTVCHEELEREIIKADGHKETTVVTNPTCTDKGFTTYTCTVCKESYTDTFVDALGHKYGEWTEDLAPTCTTAGQKTAYCNRCDKYITEVIPVIPHNYGEWKTVKEATCTEKGSRERVCSVCNDIETETINALEHDFSGEWIISVPATCEALGQKYTVCKNDNCSAECWGSIPVDKNKHANIVTDKAVSPTCTSTGLTEGSHCSVCNTILVAQEVVPALGHTSSDWITDTPATCTSVGSKHKECTVCHTTLETGTIAVIAHNEKAVITAPTCTEKGYTTYTCTDCGNTRKGSYVNAKGHRETNWLVDKAPTCTSTGSKHIECADCGIVIKTATMDKLAHTEGKWITDKKATVYSEGKKHLECKNCKATIKTATIEQLVCSKPKLTKIENTSSGVKISWDKKSGADSYRVYRKTKNGSWKHIGSTSKLYYTDKTAKSGTKYYYAVKARNEAGNSSLSSSLSKYYLADPTLKTPTSARKGITLKWNRITGAQGYVIYRKTADGSYKKLATVKGSTKTSYVDKSAKKGKKYTYKVKAYYSKTYSAYSNTKTIKDRY